MGSKKGGKLWQKGIPLDKRIEAYTVGEDYLLDQKLVPYDCKASIAHARVLEKAGLLTRNEVSRLSSELEEIIRLHEKGKFPISREDEDCHTAIENHLTRKLGDLGKKIHTARSRNDQVLTALRLYYKDKLVECGNGIEAFIASLKNLIRNDGKIPLPGYTHTRKAMPSSVALWGGAFADSMKDNAHLLDAVLHLVDQSPLGTAAGYGVPLKIDRKLSARLLGFKRVQENPVYAQLSRGKFESTLLHLLTQIMIDLNRMASDLIFFTLPELGYFRLPDAFCTGSSIMPQKKNPDVLELVRGNYHVILACETQVKTTAANLISGYNRDLQLTKKPVMTGLETTLSTLSIMRLVLDGLKVEEANCKKGMSSEIFATEEAYQLVKKGIPFREAYRIIGEKFR